MENLRSRSIQGGFAKLVAQAVSFVLRVGYLAVMARLLSPADFGLVAMVTVVTGVYDLFTNAGLSMATVQKSQVTDQQISNLFWINQLVGLVLALLCIASASALVSFYHEERLYWITVAIGAGFILNAAGVQHFAQMQRQLRYVAISACDLATQGVGYVTGIAMALTGFGYWSLVAATIATPALMTICMWVATGWIPRLPTRNSNIRGMLGFGATVTLNGLVVYVAYNLDKLLLGRYLGAEVLGIYGRAYQLINIPISNLNTAVGGVLFSALARLDGDPDRRSRYFIKGYTLVTSMTVPTAVFCGFFAGDIVSVILGQQWQEAVPIFRLLAPTVLVFGIINPTAWLLMSMGLQRRSLAVAFVIAPIVIVAYLLGLPYGPRGVAFSYSAAMILWLVPHVIWCLHGTGIRPVALVPPVLRALGAAISGTIIALVLLQPFAAHLPRPAHLVFGAAIMGTTYLAFLFYVLGQREFYLDLAKTVIGGRDRHAGGDMPPEVRT